MYSVVTLRCCKKKLPFYFSNFWRFKRLISIVCSSDESFNYTFPLGSGSCAGTLFTRGILLRYIHVTTCIIKGSLVDKMCWHSLYRLCANAFIWTCRSIVLAFPTQVYHHIVINSWQVSDPPPSLPWLNVNYLSVCITCHLLLIYYCRQGRLWPRLFLTGWFDKWLFDWTF